MEGTRDYGALHSVHEQMVIVGTGREGWYTYIWDNLIGTPTASVVKDKNKTKIVLLYTGGNEEARAFPHGLIEALSFVHCYRSLLSFLFWTLHQAHSLS